jgi:ribulose-phosphate 3-epimerase
MRWERFAVTASAKRLDLELGVKTDPVEYRYSFAWLFDLLAEEKVGHVQIGTFFEIYQLPDEYFRELRRQAANRGVSITSMFTAHRELGGFFRDDGPGWEAVARGNYERLIHVAGLLGAKSIGSNPGAVLRDRMGTKPTGIAAYLRNMKQLMHVAHDQGIEWLTIEPMSCLAEPPTLPQEMSDMAGELMAYHAARPGATAKVGFCVDVAHGYADGEGKVIYDNMQLLEAALPHTSELHLKNTDAKFSSTFGFSPAERERGIVDVRAVRDLLCQRASVLPVDRLIGYLETGGPKLGRDYSDGHLGEALRQSLRHLRETFPTQATAVEPSPGPVVLDRQRPTVQVAPSLMCADLWRFEDHIRRLEAVGVDLWHLDIMDAHFVPNMPLGLETIRQLRPRTHLPFDAHLMVENAEFFIEQLAAIGVQQISVHVEASRHLDRVLNLIRGKRIKAGVALNPSTPVAAMEDVLASVDYVLIMTVNPGFAGQSLCASALTKIADCRRMLDGRGYTTMPIEVDGNVSFENAPKMVAAGADILVAGTSSLFSRSGTLAENAARLRQAIDQGLRDREQAGGKERP